MSKLIAIQKKYPLPIILIGIILSIICFPRAIGLLSNIQTDLINLLPDSFPSVKQSEIIKKQFDRRSSLFLIINSPNSAQNQLAMLDMKNYLLKDPQVGEVRIEKRGYDFFNQNKLLLLDLKDLYKINNRLKDRIQKEKLGGLYLDFEDEDTNEDDWDSYADKYADQFVNGVDSRYLTNNDQTVFVLDIYPKKIGTGLQFFKDFGKHIQEYVKGFSFNKYDPQMKHGYTGSIITRVDQYDAIITDLKNAALISGISIFLLLYLYFINFLSFKSPNLPWVKKITMPILPVAAIFIPMLFAIILTFSFCSYFIQQLNVITSFLFAIIFGLGVDIGIHLISRYFQDRQKGYEIDNIHHHLLVKTGKSCAIGILTTCAGFYVLVVNDFKGFSEFGWIAGHGLIIALLTYLIFFPCILLLIDRFNLFHFSNKKLTSNLWDKNWIPKANLFLTIFIIISLFSLSGFWNVEFEWNFKNLKFSEPDRRIQNELLKQTRNRVNSPAVYLINNEVEARKIAQKIRQKQNSGEISTIQYYRSYYDMFPFSQPEKFSVLSQINHQLNDDALNTVEETEREIIDYFQDNYKKLKAIYKNDIPKDIHKIFWGKSQNISSVAYIMPKPHLDLENGVHAINFYNDIGKLNIFDDSFYAVSDSIVFAEVLITLFKDARIALILASLAIGTLIFIHFKRFKPTFIILFSLFCGLLWLIALMPLFKIKLNFYNMIIIPALIGMGVDNAIHIYHRFEELGKRSILLVLKTSGGAAFMASLTTVMGYSGLLFTSHPGLKSIGILAILGMSCCLVASLVLLPLMIQVFCRSK
ncbi:hypothetical protein BVY03_04110 [bacterium K02(2017)]|nr:hypothetical protein BVY03_04110 [bacterium K02(2017)]